MFTVNTLRIYFKREDKKFQNISCLRLIQKNKKNCGGIKKFQNISCLRLIKMLLYTQARKELFQNISCLRLIAYLYMPLNTTFAISKHFMFTVNDEKKWLRGLVEEFQNISCLRLIKKQKKVDNVTQNFKTFHVYG